MNGPPLGSPPTLAELKAYYDWLNRPKEMKCASPPLPANLTTFVEKSQQITEEDKTRLATADRQELLNLLGRFIQAVENKTPLAPPVAPPVQQPTKVPQIVEVVDRWKDLKPQWLTEPLITVNRIGLATLTFICPSCGKANNFRNWSLPNYRQMQTL